MPKILCVLTGSDHWTLTDGTKHPTGFWAEELLSPLQVFADAGIDVDLASPGGTTPVVDEGSLAPETIGEEESAKQRKALDDLSEEGVIQVFYPEIGAQWIVGVVGQLQLEVLVSRLEAEYKVEAALEASPFATARWLKGSPAALKNFEDFNRPNLAKDRDGDLVFMARSPWDVGYQQEKNPELTFSATKER